MSLLESMMENFVLLEKTRTADGEGGFVTTWTSGITILAVATLDSSTQARIAEHDGVTNLYTITTKKNITLDFHDVLKRISDGKIFRVTSDGEDKKTPAMARLDMRQVSAEEWELTTA